MAEIEIRQLVETFARSLRAKDIEGVMSLYAPSLVSFDLGPPLRYAGTDSKRRAWLEAFAASAGDFGYEVHDLKVTGFGDLAFAHSLNHVTGTLANGRTIDMWVRWTACFRRIDGGWRIVHDHVSVPADLEHGRAAVDLTP